MQFIRWTFRLRLAAVMLAVGVLPILATAALALRMSQGYVRHLAIRKSEALVDAVRANLELYASHRAHSLETLAASPAVQGLQTAKAREALKDFAGAGSFFVELQLLDPAGNVVAAEPESALAELPALAAAARPGWLRAPGKPGRSEPGLDIRPVVSHSGRSADMWTVPVRAFADPERVVGALRALAVLDGSGVQDILNSYSLVEDDYIAVADRSGEILARTGRGLAPQARKLVLPAELGPGSAPVSRAAENGGRDDLVSVVFSPTLGAWVAAGQPARQAFALSEALRSDFAVLVLLAVLASFAASAWLARTISGPVLALAHAIDLLKDGVLSHRIEADTEDELGTAARSYNALAEGLQRKTLIASIWQKLSGERQDR